METFNIPINGEQIIAIDTNTIQWIRYWVKLYKDEITFCLSDWENYSGYDLIKDKYKILSRLHKFKNKVWTVYESENKLYKFSIKVESDNLKLTYEKK